VLLTISYPKLHRLALELDALSANERATSLVHTSYQNDSLQDLIVNHSPIEHKEFVVTFLSKIFLTSHTFKRER
jgi:hypothetical protein